MMRITLVVTGLTCILLVYRCAAFGQSKGKPKEQTLAYNSVSTRPGCHPVEFKTWFKGTKWRFEERTRFGEETVDKLVRIAIYSEGWLYQLHPETKTGLKQKISPDRDSVELLDCHIPFLRYYQKLGAKKVGSEKLNGQECDIYEVPRRKSKIWVRKEGGWVVKEEGGDGSGKFKHEVKDLKVGVPVDDSLFVLPKGYKLEER
jgi:hypothetical protein